MSRTTTAILVTALCTGAATAYGQPAITKSNSVSTTATIQAIDSTARTVTLRDEAGQEDLYNVGPEVKRFNELKVGDRVKMTYYESVVLQIRKPGADEKPGAAAVESALNRGKGALPAGTMAVQEKVTVTVKAIDPTVPAVAVTTPDGRTVTRKVEDKKHIEGLAVGDLIDITYTRAVLASIERAK